MKKHTNSMLGYNKFSALGSVLALSETTLKLRASASADSLSPKKFEAK